MSKQSFEAKYDSLNKYERQLVDLLLKGGKIEKDSNGSAYYICNTFQMKIKHVVVDKLVEDGLLVKVGEEYLLNK